MRPRFGLKLGINTRKSQMNDRSSRRKQGRNPMVRPPSFSLGVQFMKWVKIRPLEKKKLFGKSTKNVNYFLNYDGILNQFSLYKEREISTDEARMMKPDLYYIIRDGSFERKKGQKKLTIYVRRKLNEHIFGKYISGDELSGIRVECTNPTEVEDLVLLLKQGAIGDISKEDENNELSDTDSENSGDDDEEKGTIEGRGNRTNRTRRRKRRANTLTESSSSSGVGGIVTASSSSASSSARNIRRNRNKSVFSFKKKGKRKKRKRLGGVNIRKMNRSFDLEGNPINFVPLSMEVSSWRSKDVQRWAGEVIVGKTYEKTLSEVVGDNFFVSNDVDGQSILHWEKIERQDLLRDFKDGLTFTQRYDIEKELAEMKRTNCYDFRVNLAKKSAIEKSKVILDFTRSMLTNKDYTHLDIIKLRKTFMRKQQIANNIKRCLYGANANIDDLLQRQILKVKINFVENIQEESDKRLQQAIRQYTNVSSEEQENSKKRRKKKKKKKKKGKNKKNSTIFHTNVSIGNLQLEWVEMQVVMVRTVSSEKAILSCDVGTVEIENGEQWIKKLADEIYKWNIYMKYNSEVSTGEDRILEDGKENAANCEFFTSRILQKMKLESTQRGKINEFIERMKKSEDVEKQFVFDRKFHYVFFSSSSARKRRRSTTGYPNNTFKPKSHEELDEFTQDLFRVCPTFNRDYNDEYNLLKAFDRAFWMQYLSSKPEEIEEEQSEQEEEEKKLTSSSSSSEDEKEKKQSSESEEKEETKKIVSSEEEKEEEEEEIIIPIKEEEDEKKLSSSEEEEEKKKPIEKKSTSPKRRMMKKVKSKNETSDDDDDEFATTSEEEKEEKSDDGDEKSDCEDSEFNTTEEEEEEEKKKKEKKKKMMMIEESSSEEEEEKIEKKEEEDEESSSEEEEQEKETKKEESSSSSEEEQEREIKKTTIITKETKEEEEESDNDEELRKKQDSQRKKLAKMIAKMKGEQDRALAKIKVVKNIYAPAHRDPKVRNYRLSGCPFTPIHNDGSTSGVI